MQLKHLLKKYCVISVLFIVGGVLGYYGIQSVDTLLRVKSVVVMGMPDRAVRSQIEVLYKGMSLVTLNSKTAHAILTNRFPTLSLGELRVQYPNTLIVMVSEEKPLAHLRSDVGYFVLSKTGTVLSKERSTEIPSPAITFFQTIHHLEYQTGQRVNYSAINRALEFIAVLEEMGYQTETVAIDSVDMIACKTKGFVVAFSQTRPVEIQSHEVRQIMRQIKAGALRIVRLDLRFDKPVVQLPKK